jgi:signal peptidase II
LSRSRSSTAFIISAGVLTLDRVTKHIAVKNLQWGRPVEVIPGFFNLTLVHNTGAAWGMFKDHALWLTLLAFAALIFLCFARRHFTYVGLLPRIALGLLLGGIAGNLSDRLLYGHVIDFLSFYIGRFQWPAFNVADSAICTGVGLYLLDSLKRGSSEIKSQNSEVRS